MGGERIKPAADTDIEAANDVVFFFSKSTVFEVRP